MEFSVARSVIEQMLAHQQLADDQLLQNLRSFPYRLPEAARVGDFTRLSAVDLALLVQREPGLRRMNSSRWDGSRKMAPKTALPRRSASEGHEWRSLLRPRRRLHRRLLCR